jgi:transcriptional regulator with XRE-family HTH domain
VGRTQPQFATDLGVKRGAIAQWEAGSREPRRKNYEALAVFARGRKYLDFEAFFLQRILLKQRERQEKRKEERRMSRGEDYLERVERRAAQGDAGAIRLLELSRMDRNAHAKHLLGLIGKEFARLGAWPLSEVLYKVCAEAEEVENVRSARELRNKNRLRRRGDVRI